jgi:hypothetical protein
MSTSSRPIPQPFRCSDADITLADGVDCPNPNCRLPQRKHDFEQTLSGWLLACRGCGMVIVEINPRLPLYRFANDAT